VHVPVLILVSLLTARQPEGRIAAYVGR